MSESTKHHNKYIFRAVNLNNIKNRNEVRVMEQLPRVLDEYPDFEPNILDIQDIYALSLNLLPAFYTQAFSIVLKNPVDDKKVREALRKAIETVRGNPT